MPKKVSKYGYLIIVITYLVLSVSIFAVIVIKNITAALSGPCPQDDVPKAVLVSIVEGCIILALASGVFCAVCYIAQKIKERIVADKVMRSLHSDDSEV